MTDASPPQQAGPSRRRTWTRGVLGVFAVVLAVVLAWAIEVGSPKSSPPSGVDGLTVPWESPDLSRFVADVDHAWLPLVPGARWEFAVESGDDTHVLEVDQEHRAVAGIETTVVTHRVTGPDGGAEVAFTADVAQDVDGHLWLLALDIPRDPTRSWSVEDGAAAGLLLPADPRRGDGHAVAEPSGQALLRAKVAGLSGDASDRLALELSTVPHGVDEYTQRWDVVLERGTGPVAFSSYATGTATLVTP